MHCVFERFRVELVVLADDGKRVLLMDADLHRGRVPLKLRQEPGPAEWLATTQRPPFQSAEEQRFLTPTTGTFPPNPSDLINEPLLAQIFALLGGWNSIILSSIARLYQRSWIR